MAETIKTMKAVVYNKAGKPRDILKVVDNEPIPEVVDSSDNILIKVHYTSINPVDWKTMLLPNITGKNFVPGRDLSGVVVKAGSGSKFKVGDAVFGMQKPLYNGTAAEYTLASSSSVALKPDGLSFEEAGALPLVALTSYQALHKDAKIKSTDKVFVNGGSSGTGSLAVQLAKLHGCYVAATCSTKNVDFVKGLGADRVVDYTQEKYSEVLKGEGFDVFVDCVGEAWDDAQAILASKNARFLAIAMDKSEVDKLGIGSMATFGANALSRKFWSNFGYSNFHIVICDVNQTDLETLASLYSENKIKVTIDKTFPLDQIVDAYEYSMSRRATGKILVKVTDDE